MLDHKQVDNASFSCIQNRILIILVEVGGNTANHYGFTHRKRHMEDETPHDKD